MKKHINSPQGYPGGCNGPAAVLQYTRTEATWRWPATTAGSGEFGLEGTERVLVDQVHNNQEISPLQDVRNYDMALFAEF